MPTEKRKYKAFKYRGLWFGLEITEAPGDNPYQGYTTPDGTFHDSVGDAHSHINKILRGAAHVLGKAWGCPASVVAA